MYSRVFVLVALVLFVCGAGATGTGRSLRETTVASASASASSSSSNGGTARAAASSIAKDGAKVNTASRAVSVDGGDATVVTVAEGEGDVVIDRRTAITAAGETAKATVAVFVSKVANGISKEALEKEFIAVLDNAADPFVFVRTLAVGLLEPGPIKAASIAAAESLLRDKGCAAFRTPFIGFSLPIARIEGGCGPLVNACIFDKCPGSCCSASAKAGKTCGCSGSACAWAKGSFSKPEYSPFFWKCKDCNTPVDSCICL